MENIGIFYSVRILPIGLKVDIESVTVIASDHIPTEVIDKIAKYDYSWKHICSYLDDQYFLLERFSEAFWITWTITAIDIESVKQQQKMDSTNLPQDMATQVNIIDYYKQNFKTILNTLSMDKSKSGSQSNLKLSMTPPNADNHRKLVTTTDPKSYLEIKYYELLFAINIPLAYFVKSSLSRFRNMCKAAHDNEHEMFYQAIMSEHLLTVADFDKRYDSYHIIRDVANNQNMENNRRNFLSKYSVVLNNDSNVPMQDLSTILKAREIKLQVIILLETIYWNGLDQCFINFENTYKKSLKKRSINVTKRGLLKSRRNLIKNAEKDNNKSKISSIDYCEQLDLYLDKLSILDILLASEPTLQDTDNIDKLQEQKLNITNRHKEASSFGFINYILIPFFKRKVPNSVQFIISKLKVPDLKSHKVTKQIRRSSQEVLISNDAIVLKRQKVDSKSSSRISSTPSSPKLGMQPLMHTWSTTDSFAPELLNSRTSSNLTEFLESNGQSFSRPTLVSRTKSDLTFLQKRQLSVADLSSGNLKAMNEASPDTNKSNGTISINSWSSISDLKNHSFRRVGKRKLENEPVNIAQKIEHAPEFQNGDHMVQVTATPSGKKKVTPRKVHLNSIVESPMIADSPLSSLRTIHESPVTEKNKTRTEKTSSENKKVRRRLFAP